MTKVNWLKELARKETVYEFRQAYYQLSKISKSDDVLCPACPKEGGTKFVSLDGNFGLIRRRKAGDSFEPPKHDGRLFMRDKEVQEFVGSYNDSSSGAKDCHRFKAGDKVRSKSRASKMDIKGVLGCVCRHESPILFMNLQHGERLAYPVLLLNKLLDKAAASNQKLNVTYDIACVLTSHLKNRHQHEMLNNLKMTIPIFHCYGHKASCQVEFSQRRTKQFGLTDGESIERLSSYLRRFCKITKEMTPSHRVDLLTDALLHYAKRKERNIGMMLMQKHKNAKTVLKTAEKNHADKIKSINKVIDQNTIRRWIDEEKAALCSKRNTDKAPWEETYVFQLGQLDSLRSNPDSSEQYTSLHKSVCNLEKSNGVTKRWKKDDAKFKSAHIAQQHRCRINCLDKMREVAKERMFLLDLKKKYFDGQTVAIRISRQISKTSVSLRKLLATYKTFDGAEHTTFSDVSNPEGNIYLPACETSKDDIPSTAKREIIKLHYLKERATEEIIMVEHEMENVMNYYLNQHTVLHKQITEENVAYGKRSFLIFNAIILERKLKSLETLFNKFITTPTVPNTTDYEDVHVVDVGCIDYEGESLNDLNQDLVEENEDSEQYSSDECLSDEEFSSD
ncbi:uncharacterized protein LOC117104486 isoform X2 [Anneissia japonica]|uniref:uncharacterized protein LOC117104486 isoform X2 n=1 Tax=Anneissia japonica TaxID=1529436 RepID=UPI0014257B8C|nr:uncharacterized protein LOC117104486 isoform X2 [Anneissia japonica]